MRQAKVNRPPTEEDDEIDDLPPIDGDEVEDEELADEELDETPLDDADPMDDSTGEGDPLEEFEVSGSESGWLDDAGESDGLDVGTPDTFGAEEESSTLLEGAEEADADEDDLALGGALGAEGESIVGDAGEEGFEDEPEDMHEEDLPRLDSGQDDTDESQDTDLLDGLPDEETEEPRPAWDDRAWERVEGGPVLTAAVDLLALDHGGLVLGGDGIARLPRGDVQVTALDATGLVGAPRALGVLGTAIVASSPRSGAVLSTDGGRTFHGVNDWRSLFDLAEGERSIEVVALNGDLWGKTASGALVWSGDLGATWSRVLPDYRFEAIAADGGTGELVAVAREATLTTIARGAGGKLSVSSTGALARGKPLTLVADRGRIAVALGRGGAFRQEGDAWSRLDGTAGLTAMTFARADGTLLVALHSESEGRSWILEARVGSPPFTVAELGETAGAGEDEEGDEARIRALAWDSDAGVVWAGGGFGLVAFRPARH